MPGYESVVVVGPAGGGKTAAVEPFHQADVYPRLWIPPLITTVPVRTDDKTKEHLSRAHFKAAVLQKDSQGIRLYWGHQRDWFGFREKPETEQRLAVYLADDYFLFAKNPAITQLLNTSVIVRFTSDKTVERNLLAKPVGGHTIDDRIAREFPLDITSVNTSTITALETHDVLKALIEETLSIRTVP